MKPTTKQLPAKGVIDNLVQILRDGSCNRVENNNVVAYKVASINPKIYTIRVDIKIEEEQE